MPGGGAAVDLQKVSLRRGVQHEIETEKLEWAERFCEGHVWPSSTEAAADQGRGDERGGGEGGEGRVEKEAGREGEWHVAAIEFMSVTTEEKGREGAASAKYEASCSYLSTTSTS